MKMIIAIIQDEDANKLSDDLATNNYRVTKLATTGGFLKAGNTTMLIGVDVDKVKHVIDIIERNCSSRTKVTTSGLAAPWPNGAYVPYPIEVTVGGATIFVLDVDQFIKI